jgi:crossover junction endodeoxyribonuclease RusA
MTSYGFRVYGIPAPQGSKIPGVSSKTGKMFVREQSSKTLGSWRQDVKDAAILARGDIDTLTGPIRLTVNFLVPRPASVTPKKRPFPTVAPDLDKYVRGVGDALKQAGVYKDDAQIVVIQATKSYADDTPEGSPGAWIVISEVSPTAKLA